MDRPHGASDAARDRRFAELREWVTANETTPLTSHRYGDDPEQVADLRVPEGSGPHPVAVLIHGGNWQMDRTRATIAPLAVDLCRRGWATWNIEYRRLGNAGGVPATLDDVTAAIRALDYVQADIDLSRVMVVGHSSGAQLALYAAQQRDWATVVSLAGYCDLALASRQGTGEGAVDLFCGGGPEDAPEAYRLADPSALIPTGRRLVIAHGERDDRVPVAQSMGFADAAERAGDSCTLLVVPGADHFELIDPRTQAWRDVVDAL